MDVLYFCVTLVWHGGLTESLSCCSCCWPSRAFGWVGCDFRFWASPYVEAGVPRSVSFGRRRVLLCGSSQSTRLFSVVLVAGASVLRAVRHCSVRSRSSCRETWPTHTPANAIWLVSKKGQMPFFGLELRSAYLAASVAGRGAGSRRRAVIYELVTLLAVLLPAPWS